MSTWITLNQRLAKEMKIWSTLNHKNILPLLGYFVEGGKYPNFISMWMENGSLYDYMEEISGGIESLSIMSGIASGLTYLHAEGVIHADLKSPNVLISDTKEPLLADFGLSQVLYPLFSTAGQSSNSNSPTGTVRWMAREFFDESSVTAIVPNEKSDVWAFGMVLYVCLRGLCFSFCYMLTH
ncbi:kinase-like protein [Schizopora paradoxa]|uniref:Kinase-like protein n=1 Tax=Schizopora paradoxa TaxID=27342 RepID=A0A0H2RWB7_9AGAM|nr:kinase-like protein [Schizopora paradoxa]